MSMFSVSSLKAREMSAMPAPATSAMAFMTNGNFPKRALAHVQEWRTLHSDELLSTWTLARASKPLPRIEPLE